MSRRLAAVCTGVLSLICLASFVGVGKFVVDNGGHVVWLEIAPVALGFWLATLGLAAATVRLARRSPEAPPKRRLPVVALVLGLLMLGNLALVATQARLFLVGERTRGTVVGVVEGSAARRGTRERPRVEFTHLDGGTRGFVASNAFGAPVRVGDPFEVVYDPRACTTDACPEDDAVSSPTRLIGAFILGGCLSIAFGVGMVVVIVRSRGRTTCRR